ncbi:MAG: thioredoxin family protein [Gammaproteobacteria bacterium]|nr:thioredoxin family protein [Gammaproteobacteria bacterium]
MTTSTHTNLYTRHFLLPAFLAIVLIITTGTASAGEFNQVISIGDAMPAFTELPGTDGKTLSSDDLDTDVVVLVSLANHCPWVRGMDQDLVKLVESFADKSVTIVGFSVNHRKDDRLDAMRKHAKEFGYNFAYVFDESQNLGRALGAARTPEYFVFNKERTLQYTGALYNSPAKMNRDGTIKYTKGTPSEFYVSDAIEALLAGQRPAITETKAHGCSVKYETT